MKSLNCHKGVQSWNERLAACSRFLAKSGDKSMPSVQVLRANKKFEWTPECKEEFQNLKTHLSTLPPQAKLAKGDTLPLYISINLVVLSYVLVKEMAKGQVPVYVSKILTKYEMIYLEVEKYHYAMVVSVRKFLLYFYEHEIAILINQQIKHFL